MIAAQAVEEFGRVAGLAGLNLQPDGQCALVTAEGTEIGLNTDGRDEDTLVVSVVQAAPFVTAAQLLVILQTCDVRTQTIVPPVRAALQGSGSEARVIGALRLDRVRLTGQAIASAIEALQAWQRGWRALCGRND